jgi:folate-binding protein YgfZ
MSEKPSTRLTHLGLLEIQGADAEKLLQGQTTADYAHHPADQYLFAATCTPKGRAYSNFLSIKTEAGYLLIMSADIVDNTLALLNKYAVFYKADLKNVTDDYQILGSQNSGLSDRQLVVTDSHETDTHEFKLAWPGGREINIIPADKAQNSSEEGLENWQTQDILAGLPWITEPSIEQHLPQNLNLQGLDGISFTKGCYTGQEIVARLQYKGKLKSWAVPAQIDHQLAVNDRLLNDQGRNVGQVLNSTNDAALVVIQHSAVDKTVLSDESEPQTLKFENLPYTLEKDLQD